tara:strand:- start:2923 stop:3630 length:708 start_codon:yes stop_codon:yes gene_type:complete
MFLREYFSEVNGRLCFTREQGSDFAKRIAGDFNPLHDADAKRFCIPGDLLFASLLAHYGVSEHMQFLFSGMVPEGVELLLPAADSKLVIRDAEGREYLQLHREGKHSTDPAMVETLVRRYAAFSGHTFPHVLEPLFAGDKVMINPERPMVMYQSMSIDLDTLDFHEPEVAPAHSELFIDGKRGTGDIRFHILEAGRVVGHGCKHLLLRGLREYDREAMNASIEAYDQRKRAYLEG